MRYLYADAVGFATVDASIQIQGDVSTSSLEHQKETDPLHRSRVRRLSRSRVLQAFERNSKQLIRQFCEPFSEPKSYGDLLGRSGSNELYFAVFYTKLLSYNSLMLQ